MMIRLVFPNFEKQIDTALDISRHFIQNVHTGKT